MVEGLRGKGAGGACGRKGADGARLPGGARLRARDPPAAVGCKTSRGRAGQVQSVQVTSSQDMEDQDKSGQVKTSHVT